MSDKAMMLQETVEAFADLRTMLDGLRGCGGQISQAAERAESIQKARTFCAPGSFWGLRYPGDRNST